MKRQHPLRDAALFSGIALALSYFVFWGPIAILRIRTLSFVGAGRGPVWAVTLFLVGGFVPSILAIVLALLTEGRAGVRALWKRCLMFGIGIRWYATIAVVVIAAVGCQLLLAYVVGARPLLTPFLSQLPTFIPLILIGPISEELGWRGFLLERLQQRWSALLSSVAIGVVWAFWHLPLFFMVGTSQRLLHIPFAGFLIALVMISIIMTWINNNTGGSIWAAILFHWLYTYAAQATSAAVTRNPLYNWLEYVPYVLVGAAIAWSTQPNQARDRLPPR